MNIIVRYHCPHPRPGWQGLAQNSLRKLQTLATIQTARVAIEWQRRVKRAFRVMALLQVPGPDFHAEACEYTLQAALGKVVKSLEKQIRLRKNRRLSKWKTNLQLGPCPGHWARGLVGSRA